MNEPHLIMRLADARDLEELVKMLADDPLGAQRERFESPLPPAYSAALEAISSDPNNELIVVERAGKVIGMLQLTFIPYLTHQGRWRALIEGVRIDKTARSAGIGQALFEWTIQRARSRDCGMVQLTTDITRSDALRFYERLGFKATHHGMKLLL